MDHEARVALLEAHYAYVVKMAIHFAQGHETEDAIQDALLAVWCATERWDEHTSFATYIKTRIYGAVMDGRRKRGPLTRTQVARGASYPASLDELRDEGFDVQTEDPGYSACEDAAVVVSLQTLATQHLTRKQLYVLQCRVAGQTDVEIAPTLGVSKSQVCRIRSEIAGRLSRLAA